MDMATPVPGDVLVQVYVVDNQGRLMGQTHPHILGPDLIEVARGEEVLGHMIRAVEDALGRQYPDLEAEATEVEDMFRQIEQASPEDFD